MGALGHPLRDGVISNNHLAFFSGLVLVGRFAATAGKDGGVSVSFGLIFRFAGAVFFEVAWSGAGVAFAGANFLARDFFATAFSASSLSLRRLLFSLFRDP